ncbi:MAG: 3-hydroxy-3-methylglutaryl-coenzyme A (HMG-CoA) reductase isozyme [Pleopsidium flavum]|nr:MAG: 3-hydroxy-3-methylglutaryl-coenzyme A (HMG-CoA) reductase isozyme [Pleopsidium flavum]
MLGASFLPARFRTSETTSTSSKPNWLNRQITPLLQSISRRACTHPIHTIVFIALLASTTYIGLLEGSLFDRTTSGWNGLRPTDLSSLVEGSRRLRVGEDAAWKWTLDDTGKVDSINEATEHIALMTFVFPGSLSNNSPQTAPPVDAVPIPGNCSARALPSTSNPLSPISQDTTLVFSVPFNEASELLAAVQEIPKPGGLVEGKNPEATHEEKKWIMKVAKASGYSSDGTFRSWAVNAWAELLDLIKVCITF